MQFTSGMPIPVLGDSIDTASRGVSFLTKLDLMLASDISREPYISSTSRHRQALGVVPRALRSGFLVLIFSLVSIGHLIDEVKDNLSDWHTRFELDWNPAMVSDL